jgi:competence protein ComEC
MLLRHAELPDVDVLIAGHHGSKNSTSKELLDAVKPETVIISAGADNPYGHPAEELLKRLTEFGCDIYRTDENGTIIFRR